LDAGTGIAVTAPTGPVTITNNGVTSFNGSTGPVIFHPTTYTLSRGYNGVGEFTRTIYLTAGTWVLTLNSRAIKSDLGSNYDVIAEQVAEIRTTTSTSLITATTSIRFQKTGTTGFGRIMHGNQIATATVDIPTPDNYVLVIGPAVDTIGPTGGTGTDFRGGATVIVEKQ
jgi:hypothetical protein